jgi:hypothetical protein
MGLTCTRNSAQIARLLAIAPQGRAKPICRCTAAAPSNTIPSSAFPSFSAFSAPARDISASSSDLFALKSFLTVENDVNANQTGGAGGALGETW